MDFFIRAKQGSGPPVVHDMAYTISILTCHR
jgi:hypothetical protein